MIFVYQPPKLTDQEKRTIAASFLPVYQDQSIDNNTKRILNYILKHCNGKNSSTHPSTNSMKTTELDALNIYSFELKFYLLPLLIYSKSDSPYGVRSK